MISLLLLTTQATLGYAADKVIDAERHDVGDNALEQGITSYSVSMNNDVIAIKYTHKDPKKEGTLYAQYYEQGKNYTLKLVRKKSFINIDWDAINGNFSLTDEKGRAINFTFNKESKSWIPDNELSYKILEEYKNDIHLMVSISEDFSPSNTNTQVTTLSEYCSDYDNPVENMSIDDFRSIACREAKGECASECSNQYCYGCHEYADDDCDCVCLQGDLFCSCFAIGYPCKECEY